MTKRNALLDVAARDADFTTRARDASNAPLIETVLDVDALALSNPAAYRRLLDGFYLLLGQRRLWWQRCTAAEQPAWEACVRAAMIEIAAPSGWSPAMLADLLDLEEAFPKAKDRILRLARKQLYRNTVKA
jgi:hypothetical protein